MKSLEMQCLYDTIGKLGVTMQDHTETHVTPCEAFTAFKTYAIIIFSLSGVVFLFTWGVITGVSGLLWNRIEAIESRGVQNSTNIATLTMKLDERFMSFESKLTTLQVGQTEMKVSLQEYMKAGRGRPADQ